MSEEKFSGSLGDTTGLRKLIVENPDLPLVIFVSDEANTGDYSYLRAYVTRVEVEDLTLYNGIWMNHDDLEEELGNVLYAEGNNKNLPDDEFEKLVEKEAGKVDFIRAIVIWVG